MACNILSRLFRRRDRQVPVSADRPTGCPPSLLPAHTDKLQLEESLVQLEQLQLLANQEKEKENIFLLSCLPESESHTLALLNIPFGIGNANIQCLRNLPGFQYIEGDASESPSVGIDVLVHFSTPADAAQAMASQPTIVLGSGGTRRLQQDSRNLDTPERAIKRQKTEPSEPAEPLPDCMICCEELAGPHSRPCLHCDHRWCYPCLKTHFSTALYDQERFPAKCCGRIVHFDVAKGVLAADEYSKYKTRFEESCTTKPIYCGNPACSEFLPARLSKPDEKGRVSCFSCDNVTCIECRVLVYPEDAETHTCTEADEMTALMTQFDYKRCPRCNTGVAKMYGCSHVRCQCGAHWCWDCQRAIQICWSKPCERAREDGDMTDDYDLPAEESETDDEPPFEPLDQTQQPQSTEITSTEVSNLNTTQSAANPVIIAMEVREPVAQTEQADTEEEHIRGAFPPSHQLDQPLVISNNEEASLQPGEVPTSADAHLTPVTANEDPNIPAPAALCEYRPPAALATTPVIPIAQALGIPEPVINLDAEDQDDWEVGEFDFGDEPIDESWDTWGCLHHFELIQSSKMHQYWLPATNDPQSLKPTKHIDCLRCYKTITITESLAETKKDDDKKDGGRKDSGVDISVEIVTTQITKELEDREKVVKKKRKNKKTGDPPKVFNCRRCGVIYCIACKKATMKELNMVLDRNTYRSPV